MKVFSSLLWNSSKGRVEITGCVCILLNRPSWRSPTFHLGEKSICWHQIATCTMHLPLACWILMKSVGVMWTNMTRMQICNNFLSELQQSRSRPCHLLTFGQKSVMRKNPNNGICPAFLTQNTHILTCNYWGSGILFVLFWVIILWSDAKRLNNNLSLRWDFPHIEKSMATQDPVTACTFDHMWYSVAICCQVQA